MNMATRMTHKILRLTQVREMTGMTRSTIYLYIAKNDFPIPINIGDRAVGWVESEIQEWIEKRMSNRKLGIAK